LSKRVDGPSHLANYRAGAGRAINHPLLVTAPVATWFAFARLYCTPFAGRTVL